MKPKSYLTTNLLGVAALTLAGGASLVRGQTEWTAGSSLDLNWSTTGNWSTGVPTLADDLRFGSPIPNPGALLNPEQILLGAGSLANSLWFEENYRLTGGDLTLTSGGTRVAAGKVVQILSSLAGTALITKTGTGTLVLAGSNGFSGGIALNEGGLVALANDALGTGLVTLRRGTLTLADDLGMNFSNGVAVTGSSSIVLDRLTSGAAVNYSLGSLTLGAQRLSVLAGSNVNAGVSGLTFGATTLTASGGTFDVGSNVNVTLDALSGNFNIFKTGAGVLTLGGASTRAASTTFLTEGSLVIAHPAGLGTSAAILNMAAGTTLDLATDTTVNAHPVTLLGDVTVLSNRATEGDGVTQTLGAMTSIGSKTVTIDRGGNVTGGTAVMGFGAATTTGATTFDVALGSRLALASLNNTGNDILFVGQGDVTSGAITGGGGVTMNGTGTLNLTGASTFTGAFAINSGNVVLGNAAGMGATGVASPSLNGSSTLSINGVAPSLLNLQAASGTIIQNGGTANVAMTLTPGANSTAQLAGTVQNGGSGTFGLTVNSAVGGVVTLTGNNTYSGATTLTAGQLNVNSATAIGNGGLTLTAGILDNTSGGAIALANNNSVTLGGNVVFGGSNSLNFGTGGLNTTAARVFTLAGNSGSTLRFNSWTQTVTAATTLTINALPGSDSTLSIGTYNPQTSGTAAVQGIAGNGGNIAITGGIVPGVTAASMNFSNAGTITLTGASTYTGATTFTAGKVILNATGGTATLATTAPTFAGGTFEFRGNNTGTNQTLGNTTIGAGGSTLRVVGGTAGTTLALGATYTSTTNLGTMNIILDNSAGAAGVTTSQAAVNSILGARAATVVTNAAGVTEFAGKSGSSIVQYTGQTNFTGTTTGVATNYLVTGTQTLTTATAQPYTVKINTTGPGQSLDLGSNTMQIMGGGLLFVGADDYSINGSAVNALRSNTATASDFIVHNYGLGQLDVAATIANGLGASVVTISGTGTTRLSGINTYTGATAVIGGATLSIGSNAGLGAVATGAALTLNNGTLRVTSTLALDNAGANIRPVTLGANGGRFDVTGMEVLTVRGVVGGTGSLTKTGTGTLLLTSGVSTYSGGYTRIQEGALQLGGTAGSIAAANIIVLGAGTNSGSLVLGESSSVKAQTVAGLFTSGTGLNNSIVAGGNAGNSTLTFTGNFATPSVFGGTIGGAGTNENNLILAVTAGSLTLTGNNTYTGGTNLTGGLLNLGSANAISSGPLTITGGNLDNTSGSAIALSNNVALNGNVVFGASNSIAFSPGAVAAMGASRIITLLGSPTNNNTLSFDTLNVAAPALTLTVNREQGSGVALNIGSIDLNTGASGTATIIAGTGLVNVGTLTATAANTPFTYSGTGVLTISGQATYGGLTSFTGAGTVRLLSGGNLPATSGLTVSGGNTFDLNGKNQTVATLTLAAAGTITNSSGTPSTITATNIAASSGHLSGNLSGDFTLTGAAAAMSGTYTNTGNLAFNNAGTGALTVSGSVLNTGNVTFNANSNQAVTVSAPLFNPTGQIINSGVGTGTTTISTNIGPAVTGITQNSANSALVLAGANRYSGPLQINAGLLQLTQASALYDNNPANWTTSNIIVGSGGTLGLSVGGASGFTHDDLELLLGLGSPTGGLMNGSTVLLDTTNAGGLFTFTGNLVNTDGGLNQIGVTKAGNGTLVLAGTNSYTGITTINGGTLVASLPAGNLVLNGGVLETNGTLGRGLGSGNNQLRWTVGANGGFSAAGGALDASLIGAPSPLIWDSTPDFISGAGQFLFGSSTADDVVTFSNDIDLNGALRVIQVLDNPLVTTDRAVLSGILSGTGGLNKTGAGVLALTGANTYSDVTTLTLGTLQLGNASNGGLGSGQLNLVAGTLQPLVPGIVLSNNVLLTANTLVGTESLEIAGELTGNTGGNRTLNNNLELGNTLTLGRVNLTNDVGTTARVFTITGSGDTTISGPIANAPIGVTGATPTLTISSSGLTIFQGANTYTGATALGSTTLAAGTLRVAAGSNLSTATTTIFSGTLDLQNGLQAITGLTMGNGPLGTTSTVNLNEGTLNLGGTVTYTASANSGTANITSGTLNLLGNRTFTINDSTQTDSEMVIDAVIANGDATARTVTKGGGGTLILNAANTYTGTTTMTNGVLVLRGSIAEAGATALTASRLILDFESANTTKLNPASSLSLSNSIVNLTGNSSAASSQVVNGLTLNAGASRIELDHGTGQIVTLTLGAINRAALAGTIDFAFTLGSGFVETTSVNTSGSILGGWATVNRSTFATVVDGMVTAFDSTTKDDLASWLTGEDITDSAGYFGSLDGNLTINSLRFNAADASSVVDVGLTNTLRIASGGILVTPNVNLGAASITGGVIAGTAGVGVAAGLELIIHQNNIASSFNLGSQVTGPSILTKAGNGTLVLAGINTHRGDTNLLQGTLIPTGGNGVGGYSQVVMRNMAGVTLDLSNGNERVAGLSGGGTLGGTVLVGSGTLQIANQSGSTRTYVGTLQGDGTLVKSGANIQIMQGNSSALFTGNVVINGGLLQLNAAAGRLGATSYVVNAGGELLTDQEQTSSIDRIANGATVVLNNTANVGLLTVPRGLWLRTTGQNGTRADTIGTVNVGMGHNIIQATNNAAASGTSQVGDMIITSLTRNDFATALVRGQNLGGASGARGLIRPQTAPAGVVGGAGAAATQTISIVPWIIGAAGVASNESDANVALQTGNSFVTWVSAAVGLRPLNLTTEYTLNEAGYNGLGATTTNNLRFAANPAAPLTGAAKTINSLVLDSSAGALSVTGPGNTLTLTSGALLATTTTAANGITLGGFSGILAGASNEYLLYVTNAANTLTLNSPLTTAAASLTKSGGGTLVLNNAASTYGGGTRFNQGLIEVSDLNALGSGALTFSGGGLRWATGSSFDPSARAMTFGLGNAILDTNGNDIALANSVGNAGGGGLVKSGVGSLTLNAAASFAGDTTINGGSLVYGVAGALPVASNLILGVGTLDHASFVTTLKGLLLAGNGTLGGAADLTFTGDLEANGAASRTLTVNNSGITTFDGQHLVIVDRGTTGRTLTINGTGDVFINSAVIDGTAAGTLSYTGVGTLTMTGLNMHTGATTLNNNLGTMVLDGLGRVTAALTVNAGTFALADTGMNQTFGLLTMGGGAGNVDPLLNSQANFTIGAGRTINSSSITYSATNNNLAAIIGGDGTLDLGSLGYTVTIGNSTAVETDMFWQMNTLTGSGIFIKTGTGTLDITGIANNEFSGSYQVNQGGIVGLNTVTNNIILNGGVFEGSGAFVRGLGTGDNQIQWLAGANGGFAALGGPLNVNLGAGSPDPLVWDSTPFFVSGAGQLLFGSVSANDVVTFSNNIDLNGATRQVQVLDNTLSTNDKAVLSGVVSNGVLEKTGTGFLELSGANTFSELVMTAGTLQFSTESNLGPSETLLRLNGGTLSFIGSTNLDLSRPIVTTASGGLNASGTDGAIVEYSGLVSMGNNNALTLSGTGEGRITGGIIQPTLNALVDPPAALNTADLTVASGTWTITGPTANYTIADDLLINGGVVTLENTVLTLNDDVVVTNAVLNLNNTGVLNALVTAGTSSALHSRNGATINLNADDAFTGLDLLMVGDATAGAVATLNINSFNINSPRLDVGGIANGLEGLLVGTGTITSNFTGTDYAQGFRFFRGTVNTKLAGSSSMLKQGLGDVTLTADNSGITSTVATRIDAGNLILDYSLDNNNKISSTAALDMRGSNLILNGGILADTVQNVLSFTLASGGMNTITVNSPGAFTTNLNLGAITRANSAGTVRFFPSLLGSINTTTTNNVVTGMLGTTGTAFATINDGTGTYFAINDGTGKIVPLTYGAPQTDVTSWLSTNNVTDGAGSYAGTIVNGAVNSIRFDGAAASTVSISPTGTLVVGSGGILQTSNVTDGASRILGGGRLVSGTGELVVTTDSLTQALEINARIAGGAAMTKAGNGTLLLSGFGDYSGATQIQGGTLQVSGGQAIGDNSAVTLSDDRPTLFQLLSDETIGSLAGGSITTGLNTLAVVNIGANRLTVNGSAAGTYNGEVIGTGTIVKTGTATQTLGGVSANFTGNLIINQGQLSLSNRAIANFSNLGSLTLNSGTLLLDFTGGTEGSPNKINNAAPVTLINTAGIDGLRANNDRNDASKAETLGALTFLGGANTVTVSASSGSGLTQRNMTITATSLVRSNRSTLLVRGQNLGTPLTSFPLNPLTNAPFSPIHTGRFVATAAPAGTGGAGAVGSTTLSIVPWAVGSTSITGTGDSFVAYAATTGFRPLDLVNEYEQLAEGGGGTAANNVRFASGTDLTLVAAGARTMNSLLVANTGTGLVTLTGNGSTLNVVSGAFLATGNQPLVLGGFSGITSGAPNEYIFHISNTSVGGLTVGSPFTTTAAAFTKSGAGLLTLNATGSTYTGPTTLNQGALQIDALDKLGNSGSGGIVFNGGALRFGGVFDPSILTLTFGVASTATVTTTQGGTLDTNGFDIVLANAIGNGGNGGMTKAGVGSLTLNAPITYTGVTTVTGGTLTYGVPDVLPLGRSLVLGGGTLDHAAFATNLSSLQVDANSSFIGSAPLNLTGSVGFNGAANRTLTINNSALTTFSGSPIVVVDRGTTARTMTIDGTSNVLISGELVNGGAAGTLLYGGSGTLTFTGTSNITGGIGSGNNLATVNVDGTGRILGGITVTAGQTNLLASGQSQTVGLVTMGGGLGNVDPLLNSQAFLTIGSGITLSPSAITYVATNNNLTSVINGAGTLNLGSNPFTVTIGNSTAVDIDMSWEMATLEGSGTITKTGLGTLDIRGITNNLFTGNYLVTQGAIIGLEATGNGFTLNGGVFESNGSFIRSLGTGTGEFQWAVGANGGFAANGGNFTVNIGNGSPDPLVWRTTNPASGTPLFVSDAGQLLFGSSTANDVVTLTNNIDLDNGTRIVQVIDNTLSTADKAVLAGVISNGTLNKTGTGVLELSGANTFSSLIVTAGTLQFASASNTVDVAGNLGIGQGSITLSGGNLSFIGGVDFDLERPITTTASSGLNASGLGIGTFSGPVSMAANNVLTLSGTGIGVISGGIIQPAGAATADLVMAAGSTANWTITGANSSIADDLLINGGTLTLVDTVVTLNDDVIVSNPGTVLNLNSTGVLAANNPAGTSSGLYARNGATINLNADNINGINNTNGLDFVQVGDATVGAIGTFNTNAFSLTTPQLVVGGVAVGLEGQVIGTGTIVGTSATTDTGFLFRRGLISANLAGGANVFKSGLGVVTLSGDNSNLTGTTNARTRLDAGELILDYTTHNTSKLPSVRGLDMRGGTLTILGNSSAATTQSVFDFTLASGGANTINMQAGAGQTATLNVGLITRAASVGTLRINLSEGAFVNTTTANNAVHGLIGLSAYLTVKDPSGTWFAANGTLDPFSPGPVVPLVSTAKNDVTTWLKGDHVTDDGAGYVGTSNGTILNSLRFDAVDGSVLNLASQLRINSGGILVTDNVIDGTPGIYGGQLLSDVAEFIITQDSVRDFTISANLAANSAVTKTGNGAVVLSGYNSYTGATVIQGGALVVMGGKAIGDNSPVTLADDRVSSLVLQANETIGRLAGGSTADGLRELATVDVGSNTLTINNTGANTSYSGRFVGSGSIVKNGAGTNTNLNLNNISVGFTGSIVVNGGLFQLSNIGQINASAFTVNKNSSLLIDNNGTTRSGTRILDTTSITLNSADGSGSGETIVRGLWIRTDQNTGTTTSETVGNLVFSSGANYLTGQATGGTSATSQLIANDFIRQNNSTVNVRATNLGATTLARNQFRIGTAANQTAFIASSSNLVGGTGGVGTITQKIVPWAIGENVATTVGNLNMGNTLVTYISAQGFVPLNLVTDYALYNDAYSLVNTRESLSADLTGLVGKNVNSLVIHNNSTGGSFLNFSGTGADQLLRNVSGAFLFTLNPAADVLSNHTVNVGGFDSGIATANSEYVFHVVNPSAAINTPTLTTQITSPLVTAANITKSGRGTLVLSGTNTAGGGSSKTTLNEGNLVINDLDNIGGNTGDLVFAGGTLLLDNAWTGDDLSLRSIQFLQGGGTLNQGLHDLVFSQSLGSGVGGFTKLGFGNLTLNAPATYTGPTNIVEGNIILGANNAIGSGNLSLGNTTAVNLNGHSISVGSVTLSGFGSALNGNGSINASGDMIFSGTGDTVVDANIAAAGGLFKTQPSTLTLNGVNSFGGPTVVSGGTLLLSESLDTSSVTLFPGTTLGGVGTISGDVMLTGTIANPATITPGLGAITTGKESIIIEGSLSLGEYSVVEFSIDSLNFTALELDTLAYVDATTRFSFTAPNDYIPTPGSSFQVLTWTNGLIAADLSSVIRVLPTIDGIVWSWDVFYDAGLAVNKAILRADGAATAPVASALVSQTVNAGDPVTFSTTITGSHVYLIRWQKNDVDIPGETGLTYTIPATTFDDTAVYTVIASNEYGQDSKSATLNVRTVPVIASQPQNRLVTAGSSFQLPSLVLGPDPKTFAWTKDALPIVQPNVTGTNTGTLIFTAATLANSGSYQMSVENSFNEGNPVISDLADVVVISQPQAVSVAEGNIATLSVTAAGNPAILPGLVYKWRRNGVDINDGNEFTGTNTASLQVLVTPATAGASYSVRVSGFTATPVTTNGALLSFGPVTVIITQNPTPQIVPLGGTLTLDVQATGGLPQTYQWRNNNKNIVGATLRTLVLFDASLANAGSYTAVVSNNLTSGSSSATTTPVDVAIVDTAPRRVVLRQGSGTTLSAVAAGAVTYQWFSNNNGTPALLGGQTTNRLVIPNNLAPGKHEYFCRVTGAGGFLFLDGSPTTVLVYDAAPQIAGGFTLPNTLVGAPYEFQVPMAEGLTPGEFDHTKTASKFVAKGLPPGLVIGADGVIRGSATVAGTFSNISITASNAIAPPSVVTGLSITVGAMDNNIIGDFTGPIDRHAVLNGNLGGMVTLKTANNGGYSGKLTMGSAKYSFKGRLNVGTPTNATTTITVKRAKLTPVRLTFALSGTTQTITVGSITDGVNTVGFDGWRYVWAPVKGQPPSAAALGGYYTMAVSLPAGSPLIGTTANENIPQGNGFASFTVNPKNGKLKVVGRLADGAAFTSATYAGPHGEVLVFRTLYASNARGSVVGSVTIDDLDDSNPNNNTLSGAVSWLRPATPGTTARLYRAGFGPLDLDVVGSRYIAPLATDLNPRVLGLPASLVGTPNAVVELTEGLVEGQVPQLDPNNVLINEATFRVDEKNKAVATPVNSRNVTLVINAKTGAISGKFTLEVLTPVRVKRVVSYTGMIVGDGLQPAQGQGYFLLPKLPAPLQKPTATDILSGLVIFDTL